MQLWNQARRREVLYIAIEHNVKYLTAICQASDHAKDLALNEVASLKVEFAKQKVDFDEMQRVNKVLSKDSEQLAIERKRITQLTLDVTKAKDKEEQMSGSLKEAQKRLKKSETESKEVKAQFEDNKRNLEDKKEQLDNIKKEQRKLGDLENLEQQDNDELKKSNELYRIALVKNESVLAQQTQELKELKKKAETSKKDADRTKEENGVLLKQNQSLV